MFNQILNIIRRRHYWRSASFSEISELYIARALRIIGANLGFGFAFIFLLQLGYSLPTVVTALLVYYIYRLLLTPLVAMMIARFGPKHAILVSNILYVPGMVSLGFAPSLGIGTVIIWGLFVGLSVSIYQLAYYVDFSKVKNVLHSGKELGMMNIFEKFAIAASPVIGGLIALFFGPSALMWFSGFVILIAAIPLLSTSEPTKTHQKLNWKEFKFKLSIPSYRAQCAVGFDMSASTVIWSFFLAITIFSSFNDNIYLNLGVLSSVSFFVAILVSYFFGKLIDENSGKRLLWTSVIANSVIYLIRPFINSPFGAAIINGVNEIGYTGLSMANMRGVFDTADNSGQRILYLFGVEATILVGSILATSLFLILIVLLPIATACAIFFALTALVVLLIGSSNFAVYRK